MSCEHTRAVLQGEAPLVDTSAHLTGCADCQALAEALDAIDALAASLPPPAVPADLIAATRAAMEGEVRLEDALSALAPPPVPTDLLAATRAAMAAEIAPPSNVVPLWRQRRVWGAVAAAAALLLLVQPRLPAPADPDTLVEKGNGHALPDVALGVAVRSGESTARLRADRRYAPGDVLYFRSSTDRSTEVFLVRVDEAGADVIHREAVGPGDADLPLSWTLEVGEGDAHFALLAGPEGLSAEDIAAELSPAWPGSPCEQAPGLSLSCESVFVGLDAPPEEAP